MRTLLCPSHVISLTLWLSPLGQRLSWHCWGAGPWLAPHFFLSEEAAPLPPRQGPDALGRVTLKIPVKIQCVKAMPAGVPMSWQFIPLSPTFPKARDKGAPILQCTLPGKARYSFHNNRIQTSLRSGAFTVPATPC